MVRSLISAMAHVALTDQTKGVDEQERTFVLYRKEITAYLLEILRVGCQTRLAYAFTCTE